MTVSPLLHRVRNYEELDGGQGREVFFRPHRYQAADLLPLRAIVNVTIDGVPRTCSLLDVSQNGVAFEWPQNFAVSVGDKIAELVVSFDDYEAYRGEGRVGSVRDLHGVAIVGVSFEGPLLTIDEVLDRKSIRNFATGVPRAPWRVDGYDRYKVLISELRLFLEDSHAQFARLEKDLPWHVLHGDTSDSKTALMNMLRETFCREVVRASEEIDQAVRAAPPAHLQPLLQWSRRQLHDFFMQSPSMARCLQKPFGYPGDYECMRFIYEKPFEGPTLFAKAISLSFDETKAARAVRHRKDLVKRKLLEMINARGGPLRILAVACGPAQELAELLQEAKELPQLEIMLFDQDKGALGYAYRRLQPIVDARHAGTVKMVYLHETVKRLLRDADLLANYERFDMIYSVGLFDYFRPHTAVGLARNLTSRLADGGRAMIANMVPENPSRWYMEHHLDWWLIYRTRQELLDIGRRAAPTAQLQILEEESGVNPFVEIARV
jgi:extracellular factor (EF) 3-hydroxypalmitic acid methyl ester biosynthesis protein